MIIDFHVHCFPDEIAPRAMKALSEPTGMEHFTDGTRSGVLASMDRAGIDISVVQNIATKPSQSAKINSWAIAENSARIMHFGSIHTGNSDFEDQIDLLAGSGIRGIKLHPDYQGFFADDRRMYPVYELLRAKGMILVLHSGQDPEFPDCIHCPPDRLLNVLKDFPGLKLVAAHMGGHRLWDEVYDRLLGRDFYIDTSASYDILGSRGMAKMIRKHGADKVLFATDSPWADQKAESESIASLPIPADDIDKIMQGNAASLLGIA